jgi:branched-chain amino acid transport system ATP-binding protein
MSDFVLEAVGLRKRFGGLLVTRDVDIRLSVGDRHALIGPNGAGKTTLVGLLSGTLAPDAGRIIIKGRDCTDEAAARRVKRGLVRTFQVTNLLAHLTVFETVYLAASEHLGAARGMLRAAGAQKPVIERASAIIEELGLQADQSRRIDEIAYGRQRLVEIAIALALEPAILLLDEPAAGIPSGELPLLLDAIERLPKDIAILMIEHDMQVVRRFASEVTVLVHGAVLMSGRPDDVMASEQVRAVYLGKSGRDRFESGKLHA